MDSSSLFATVGAAMRFSKLLPSFHRHFTHCNCLCTSSAPPRPLLKDDVKRKPASEDGLNSPGLVSDSGDRSAGHLRMAESGKNGKALTPTWQFCCISHKSLRRGKCSSPARRGPGLSGRSAVFLRARRGSRAGTCGFDRLTCEAGAPVEAPGRSDGRRVTATRTTWRTSEKKKKRSVAASAWCFFFFFLLQRVQGGKKRHTFAREVKPPTPRRTTTVTQLCLAALC